MAVITDIGYLIAGARFINYLDAVREIPYIFKTPLNHIFKQLSSCCRNLFQAELKMYHVLPVIFINSYLFQPLMTITDVRQLT